MLLFLLLINICLARPSTSDDMSSDILSRACEKGLEQCGAVTAHCKSKKGRDAAKCMCAAASQSIRCISGCSEREKKEMVGLLKISSKMMCMAANAPRDNLHTAKEDEFKSLPKFDSGIKKKPKFDSEIKRKPKFWDDEDDDLDALEEMGKNDDLEFLRKLDEKNSTESEEKKGDKKEDQKAGSLGGFSKAIFYISMLFLIAL